MFLDPLRQCARLIECIDGDRSIQVWSEIENELPGQNLAPVRGTLMIAEVQFSRGFDLLYKVHDNDSALVEFRKCLQIRESIIACSRQFLERSPLCWCHDLGS